MATSKEQKEYNALLQVTQSMLGKINKATEDIAKNSDKRNKSLSQESSQLQSIVGSIKDSETASAALNKLKKQEQDILKKNFGVNEKNKASLLAQNIAAQASIVKNQKAGQIIDAVGQQMTENMSKANKKLDEVSEKLEKIPIIGKGLSAMFDPFKKNAKKSLEAVGAQFTGVFNKSFSMALSRGATVATAFGGALTMGLTSAKRMLGKINPGILKFAKGALIAGVAFFALKKMFDAGFASFKRIDAAAKEFRMSTGLLNSQTAGLGDKIKNVESSMASIGGSAEDAAMAAAEFTNTFDGIVQPSEEAMMNLVAMNKSLGVGLTEASQVAKVFRNLGDLTEDQAIAQTANVAQMAKLAGVAPQKVMADIASSSEEMYKFFGGNTKAMAATAVEAAKLGSSIKEISAVSAQLLDYDSSINKELEASAILGTNLNFSQARALAATGKTVEAYKSIGKQLDQVGDLTSLNLYEQQAIADATGQEFSSLVNQQKIRQRFGELDKQQLKAAQNFLKANGDLNGLTKERLRDQAEELKIQDEMNSRSEALSNKFGAVKTQIQNAFMPLGEAFMPVLEGMATVVTFLADGFTKIMENSTAAAIVIGGLVTIFSALAIAGIVMAINAIMASFAMIPFGIGIPLAIGAVAGLFALIGKGKAAAATPAGDIMSPADGKTQISTKEGGLFDLSSNDDVMAAPGLVDRLKSKREQRAFSRAEMNLAPLLKKMDLLITATKGKQVLVADGRQLASTTANQQEVSLKNQFGLNSGIS